LLQVQATNGTTNGRVGYVDRHLLDELTKANVSSPEEAVDWQRQQDAAGPGVILIPVYESDGTTVIGEFPISRTTTIPP
jgi:hypothetical protein